MYIGFIYDREKLGYTYKTGKNAIKLFSKRLKMENKNIFVEVQNNKKTIFCFVKEILTAVFIFLDTKFKYLDPIEYNPYHIYTEPLIMNCD